MYVKDWESPYLTKTIRAPKIAPFRAHLPGNLFAHRTANDAVSLSAIHPRAHCSRWRCGVDSLMALRVARKAALVQNERCGLVRSSKNRSREDSVAPPW